MLANTKSQKHSNQRYLNALRFMQESKEFHTGEVVKQFYITNYFPTVCAELEFIVRTHSNRAKWILDREPTLKDVLAIKKEIRKRNDKYGKSSSYNIKPLKRVASLVEPPAPAIDMHEESQLTWIHLLIIFAAGIIAGGLIATIWK